MTTTFKLMGDPHLGKVFLNNVPLHRRGDHEKIVWAEFEKQLDPEGAEVHVNLGDLFNAPVVPYSVLWRAAQLYLEAANLHHQAEFIILRGNHDASRDLEAVSAFDLFEGLLRDQENVYCVSSWHMQGDLVFFGWDPIKSATEVVTSFNETNPGFECEVAFGHWDVDPRSDPFNLIPIEQLKAIPCLKQAITGHVHLAEKFTRDGLPVTVHGSMLAYAHGEGLPYTTLTLAEARAMHPGVMHDLCVRVLLAPGEVFDLDLDCLQLQVVHPEASEKLEVELGEFDLMALFTECMAGVPANIQAEVRTRWDAAFTAKR
jgi:hypothetical protein